MNVERFPIVFSEVLRNIITPILVQRIDLPADRMHGGYLTVLRGVNATRLPNDPPDLCVQIGTIVSAERRRATYKTSVTDAHAMDDLHQLHVYTNLTQGDGRHIRNEDELGAAIVVGDSVVSFAGPPYDACEALILFSLMQVGTLGMRDAVRLARMSRNQLFFDHARIMLQRSRMARLAQADTGTSVEAA